MSEVIASTEGLSGQRDPAVSSLQDSSTDAPPLQRRRLILRGVALFSGAVVVGWLTLSLLSPLHFGIRTPLLILVVWVGFKGLDGVVAGVTNGTGDTALYLCVAWLTLLVAAAALADLLPLAEHKDTLAALDEPVNQSPNLFSRHPLGTNSLGLDLFARAVYGARASLLIAGLTVIVIVIVGGLLGLVAGYYRGMVDRIVSVITDTLLAVPPLVLLIALAAVLGRPQSVGEAVFKMSLGLSLVGFPSIVRLARANTLTFVHREFVLAARGMGAENRRIVLREVMPNVAVPILAYAAIVAALFILAEGSLSFLGLGLAQPEPTWGNMIAEGQGSSTLRGEPFIALVPGAFMFMTIYSFNRIGERFNGDTDG